MPYGFDIPELLILEQNSSNNNSIEIGQDRFEPPASVMVSLHEMQSCPFNMRLNLKDNLSYLGANHAPHCKDDSMKTLAGGEKNSLGQ